MRWTGHVEGMGEKTGGYWILIRRPEVRRQLGRPKPRWVDSIETDLQEVRQGGMDWIDLAQDTKSWKGLVNAVMNFRVLCNAANFLTS
jgi:hypothetical protein